jgi:hypothetical protein
LIAVAEQLSLLLLSELVPPDVVPPDVVPPEVEPVSSEEHAAVETAKSKQAASEAMWAIFMRPRHGPTAGDASKSDDPGRFQESPAILGRWNSKSAPKSWG